MIYKVKHIRRAYVNCWFASRKKRFLCNICALLRTFTSNRELSAVSRSSNRRAFHSGINLIFNCEVMKTEFWLVVTFREANSLELFASWCTLAYLLQQKYSFMTYIKNNKARCKKCFSVVKITISLCVNRELLRMKSTTKQENNRTLKRIVISHLYVKVLAPGVCNHDN